MFKNKKMVLLGTIIVPFIVPFTVLSCSEKSAKEIDVSHKLFNSFNGVKWKNGKMILPTEFKIISHTGNDIGYSPIGRDDWFEFDRKVDIFKYNWNSEEVGAIIKSEFQNKNSLLSNKKASDIKREIEDNILYLFDETAIFENYRNIEFFLDIWKIIDESDYSDWSKAKIPVWLKKNLKVYSSDDANVAAYPVSPEINDPMDQSIWFEFEVFDKKTNTHYFAKSPKYSWWYLGEKQ